MLLQAPFDIAIKIFDLLSPKDLAALSQTSKTYHSIVQKYGWKHYYKEQNWNLLKNPQDTKDDDNEQDWQAKVAFGVTTHKNWARKEFSTTIISSQRQSYLPTLSFDHEKLVCSVGNTLDIFDFAQSSNRRKKNGQPQKINKLKSFIAHHLDITDIALCSDYNELFTCSMDHTIKRWFLDQSITSQIPLAQVYYGHDAPVHSTFQFPYDSSTLFSVSFDGKLCVWNTDTAEMCYSTQVPGIPRAMRGLSNGLIGVGNKSTEHLTLYKVTPNELVRVTSVKGHKSTVYALKSTDLFPHTFLSGCYDSISRLYDLRNNSCVASFKDPFDTNPVFSVDYDRYRVASGSSMHGLIRLWDMRYYKSSNDYSGTLKKGAVRDGWSIFLGKSQNSPVYSLQMSHSRLVAALANQTWMLDFGDGGSGLSSTDSPHSNFHRSRYRSSGERRSYNGGVNAPLYYLHQEWNKIYEASS